MYCDSSRGHRVIDREQTGALFVRVLTDMLPKQDSEILKDNPDTHREVMTLQLRAVSADVGKLQ